MASHTPTLWLMIALWTMPFCSWALLSQFYWVANNHRYLSSRSKKYADTLPQIWQYALGPIHQIRVVPDFGSGKFLADVAEFGGCQYSCMQYVQLITYTMNAADLWSGVFAILISVTRMIKIQNPLPFHDFRQKLANSNVTKQWISSWHRCWRH